MANVFLDDIILTQLANTIRSGTGGTEGILPANMPTEIYKIIALLGENDMNIEEIWTNENPSAEFAAQTITFDKSYKMFMVCSLTDATSNATPGVSTKILIPMENEQSIECVKKHMGIPEGSTTVTYTYKTYSRSVVVSENSINVNSCVHYAFGGEPGVSFDTNTNCVPYKIYGIS